jgi:hypothetical protein
VLVLLSEVSVFVLAPPLDGERKGCTDGSAGLGTPTGPANGGGAVLLPSEPEPEPIDPAPPPLKLVEELFFLSGPTA